MPSETPFFVEDIASAVGEIPADGILSRTVYKAANVRVVLFGFGAGQELTEHTSPYRATLIVGRGRLRVTVGAETFECAAGSCLIIPPQAPHGLYALEESAFLLLMTGA
ncbi:hypothetical protein ARMA_2791 [Ardenticatena maritima]|uniref:Cupin type-2 domain-containing protein n=1 Tax=Ardenticatena maritima TaxID=872965 RepID=A0A0M9UDT5_9CHLR|nr:cupin domain-containing protein [Ardenticatena maritima]KPL87253.1 hypothetical protein SE16_12160 [Ardenticatena maritima]GAP64368.1 hypothetical protein ARMA_2791 [Ardenticatena maritima]